MKYERNMLNEKRNQNVCRKGSIQSIRETLWRQRYRQGKRRIVYAVIPQVRGRTVGTESKDKNTPSKAIRVRTMRKRPWNLYLSNPQIHENGQADRAASQGTYWPHWCIWNRGYRQKQNAKNRYLLPLCREIPEVSQRTRIKADTRKGVAVEYLTEPLPA